MKHPFLPNIELHKLKREYLVQVAIVFAFLASIAGLIGLAALFPAYIRAYVAESNSVDTVVSLKDDTSSANASVLQSQLSTDSNLVKRAASLAASDPAAFIATISSLRKNVSITSISFDQTDAGVITSAVQGIAPTRDDLSAFKDRLESSVPGVKVYIPESQYTKRVDVVFSLKITQTLK